MTLIKTLIYLLSITCIAFAGKFDPKDAVDYLTASAITARPPDLIMSWNCGEVCQNLTGYQPYHTEIIQGRPDESFAFTMFFNKHEKKFVTAFRGTGSMTQLQLEIAERDAVPYELKKIPGALGVKYFYNGYVTVRQAVLQKLKQAYKAYRNYDFIFTGHSLGGALATFAAFDAVSLRYAPSCQVSVYSFGSPRIGNQALATAIEKAVPEIYRVVHWKDAIVHFPFCVRDQTGQCVPKANPVATAAGLWPVWHIGQEVFYNAPNTDYTICKKSEDPKCANQFSLTEITWLDHPFYMNRVLSEDGRTIDVNLYLLLDQMTRALLGL